MEQQTSFAASQAAPGKVADHKPHLRIILAAPRGFCAGVTRAIDAVENALTRYGPPVYVRHAIVHNLAVVRSLESKGAVFVQELDEVPENGVVIMSAHGVTPSIRHEADRLHLRWFDAVCPLVVKVHREVARHHAAGRHVIVIGHKGHPEIIGTLGHVPADAASVVQTPDDVRLLDIPSQFPVAYAIQTTYSVDDAKDVVDAIHSRFLDVCAPSSSDICYATTNRQAALRKISGHVDAVIVVGECFSSNASRLAEVASASGCPSVQLVAKASSIDWSLLAGARTLGLTAAASTPEHSVESIIGALGEAFEIDVHEDSSATEKTVFKPLDLS